MQSGKNGALDEYEFLEIVYTWINENPDHFGTAKKDYRPAHIKRVMRYLHAPDEYLTKRLEIIPDSIKWYFRARTYLGEGDAS